MANAPLQALYQRPGFMFRRAHQIAVSIFLQETASLGITTTQYGILFLLRYQPNVDQITLARLIGLDRSTVGMVIKTLEDGGLIRRAVSAGDKRRRSLALTKDGVAIFRRLQKPAARALERLVSPLEMGERKQFLKSLNKLVSNFDMITRVPLIRAPDAD